MKIKYETVNGDFRVVDSRAWNFGYSVDGAVYKNGQKVGYRTITNNLTLTSARNLANDLEKYCKFN